jgi:hypothetical protein
MSDQPRAPNPFDPTAFRLSQDFVQVAGVKKQLTHVSVRKPSNQEFFRVHPGEDYRLSPAGVITLQEDRETYLVRPQLVDAVLEEVDFVALYTAISRSKVLFILPAKLPKEGGRDNEWHRSRREAAERAMTGWVRATANQAAGTYDMYTALNGLPEPEWPEYTFAEILAVAFRDKIIDSEDHPVIRRLRGLE